MNKRAAMILLAAAVFAVMVAGATVSPPVAAQFPSQFGAQRWPAIDVDKSDKLYLTMSVATKTADQRTPGSQIFFTLSTDGGTTWDNFPQMRNLSHSPGEAFGPSLAVNRKGTTRAYIVYHDNQSGTTQSYLIRSKKKAKFKRPVNITPHDGGAISPRVALDSNEAVNVVWGDVRSGSRQIVFVRSTDQGDSFSGPISLSRSGAASEPEIAVGPDDAINVVWEDAGAGQGVIMFARSTDGGKTFSEPRRISSEGMRATEAQIISDGAGRLSAAWVAEIGSEKQAFYSRSTDGGETFSGPVNISNISHGDVHKPTITTFENTVYVAFQDGDLFGEDDGSTRQVYLVKSTNGGESFSDPVQVSNANKRIGRAHSPAIVVDGRGVLHIVWIDSSRIGKDEGILYYSNTRDGRRLSQEKEILAFI